MASRRDELNAYTFARKRTVAAFLRPSPSGSEEGAPRPLHAVGPSLVAGALLLAGFGAWGMIKPGAPQGWNKPGEKVLVGSESTTRYVILRNADGKPELHPVLNLASAKLLLDPQKFGVLKIQESILDSGRIPHGPTLGIPYAPDRLPSGSDAGTAKLWSVCEQPDGGDANSVQKAAFVLADRDAPKVDGGGRLHGDQALYVQGPDGARYLVDADGTSYLIGGTSWRTASKEDLNLLVRVLFGQGAQPQVVSADWLKTFNQGRPLDFPQLDGVGTPAGVRGLSPAVDKIGMVISAPGGTGDQEYVVLRGKVAPVSALVGKLLLNMRDLPARPVTAMYPGARPAPQPVAAQDFTPDAAAFYGDRGWPQQPPRQANTAGAHTACSVYRGTIGPDGRPQVSVWVGPAYPAPVVDGTSAYVTPGSGLLYRQVSGANTADSGQVFLVTDTGLRYAVQSNDDSAHATPGTGAAPLGQQQNGPGGAQQADEARARLGYAQVQPVPVPQAWSSFRPTGPTLATTDARQPPGS